MVHIVRQTDLTLQDLIEKFQKSNTCSFCHGKGNSRVGLPVGLLINEIGAIFLKGDVGDDEHDSSESFLRRIMEDDLQYEGNRATAYFYLRHPTAKKNEETTQAIDSFERDSSNGDIVDQVLVLLNAD